jgi:hypothetical protein
MVQRQRRGTARRSRPHNERAEQRRGELTRRHLPGHRPGHVLVHVPYQVPCHVVVECRRPRSMRARRGPVRLGRRPPTDRFRLWDQPDGHREARVTNGRHREVPTCERSGGPCAHASPDGSRCCRAARSCKRTVVRASPAVRAGPSTDNRHRRRPCRRRSRCRGHRRSSDRPWGLPSPSLPVCRRMLHHPDRRVL